MHNRKEMM